MSSVLFVYFARRVDAGKINGNGSWGTVWRVQRDKWCLKGKTEFAEGAAEIGIYDDPFFIDIVFVVAVAPG